MNKQPGNRRQRYVGALPMSYVGISSRGRTRTCDHPLKRRSNPGLHHRPNCFLRSPGNERKEFEADLSRYLACRGYAPVPGTQRPGKVRHLASTLERSNSSLSPPAKLAHLTSSAFKAHLCLHGAGSRLAVVAAVHYTDTWVRGTSAKLVGEQRTRCGLAPWGVEPRVPKDSSAKRSNRRPTPPTL